MISRSLGQDYPGHYTCHYTSWNSPIWQRQTVNPSMHIGGFDLSHCGAFERGHRKEEKKAPVMISATSTRGNWMFANQGGAV